MLYSPWSSPGQNTGVGSHSLFQGTFPIQGLNTGLQHCKQILYQLSHKESLVIIFKGKESGKAYMCIQTHTHICTYTHTYVHIR